MVKRRIDRKRAPVTLSSSAVPSGGAFPLISVVVPLFNDPDYLPAALKSIARQSYPHLEILVVDDGSTDASAQVARDWARYDRRISVLRHAQNRGLPAARNTGLKAARGWAVAFLDSDDILYPESIWDRYDALRNHAGDAGVGGSYCRIQSVAQDGGGWADKLLPFASVAVPPVTFLSRDGECPFPAHAPLIKRSVLAALGGFDEQLISGCEDWELWQRLLRRGYVVVPSPTIGGAYRARRGSMRLRAPLAHTRMALSLLEGAERSVTIAAPSLSESLASRYPPDEIINAWPHPMTASLSSYRLECLRISRIVRATALAALNDNAAEEAAGLAMLPTSAPCWLRWSIDVGQEARNALELGLGQSRTQVAADWNKIDKITSRIVAHITKDFASPPVKTC